VLLYMLMKTVGDILLLYLLQRMPLTSTTFKKKAGEVLFLKTPLTHTDHLLHVEEESNASHLLHFAGEDILQGSSNPCLSPAPF
jgi:hypothetical protein